MTDLESDSFVGHALNSAACELYNRYGMYLAPVTSALTMPKYCQFGHQCPVRNIGNDGEPADGEHCDRATNTGGAEGDRPGDSVAESPPAAKRKDPKKVSAGRASAAAQKAKRKRILEELRVTKETLRGPKDTDEGGAVPKEHPTGKIDMRRDAVFGGNTSGISLDLDRRWICRGSGSLGSLATRDATSSARGNGTSANEVGNAFIAEFGPACSAIKG